MLSNILAAYDLGKGPMEINSFGTGLINHTWKVTCDGKDFLLQRINHFVFVYPDRIAWNIRLMGEYLEKHHPGYLFVAPVKTTDGRDMIVDEKEGFFRLFPFIGKSHTIDVVSNTSQAFEAACEFGKFARLLSGCPVDQVKITIVDFHNLTLRYAQFQEALTKGNPERIAEAEDSVEFILQQDYIVKQFEEIARNPDFKVRVSHNDTKISNVLFDEEDKGMCVIDLDTVMPGYFISDVGDMMRTYLSPVSEEEKDFSKIEIREDFFTAIVKGYGSQMKDELTEVEKDYFLYAGKFMIYMQALRFITDYINNDVYYGSKYPGHNLMRGKNQLVLLTRLLEKEDVLSRITI